MKIKVNYREFEGTIYLVPSGRIEKFDAFITSWNNAGPWSQERDDIENEIASNFGQYEVSQDEVQLWIDKR